MDIYSFHQSLNPNNEKLYIPLGRITGKEVTARDRKQALKKPQTKWKEQSGRLNAEELAVYLQKKKIKNVPTVIGFQIPGDLTVVDVDYMPVADILTRMLEDMEIRHCRLRTNAGKHFIFKAPATKLTRGTNMATPSGMLIDQLSGIDSYIFTPFRPDIDSLSSVDFIMDERRVEKLMPKDTLDYVPEWLIGNRSLGKPKAHKKEDGLLSSEEIKRLAQESILPMPMTSGNKTDNLQRWLHNLAHRGYAVDFCEATIRLINKYVCIPSIPEDTLETEILNPRNLKNVTTNSKAVEQQSSEFFEGALFKQYEFSEYLRNKYKIISMQGKLGIYNEGVYELNEDLVRHKILQEIPILRRKNVEEVIFNIQKRHYSEYEENARPFEIVAKNGVVNLQTGTLSPFDPSQINLNKLRVAYKDYSQVMDLPFDQKPEEMRIIDNFLLEITSNDISLVRFILEMCAYTMWKAVPFKKAFILYGHGDNGKSILLHILQAVLGLHNFAALEFKDLTNESFKVANLERKLACITNDISKQQIKETNVFKAIVSGDPIEAGAKGIQAKTFSPYATIIMSANTMPRSTDTAKGFFERVFVVPLERDFVAEGIADPSLRDKVTRVKPLEYFFFLMVMASKGLSKDGFVKCTRVENASLAYRLDHNHAAKWMADLDITPEKLLNERRMDTYTKYTEYCNQEMVPALGNQSFYKGIMSYYPQLYKKRTANSEVWAIK
jgi:putative DNA primase/helicase